MASIAINDGTFGNLNLGGGGGRRGGGGKHGLGGGCRGIGGPLRQRMRRRAAHLLRQAAEGGGNQASTPFVGNTQNPVTPARITQNPDSPVGTQNTKRTPSSH
ncbi:hypothetical protein NW767_000696 [Fusarium falciforme]|nr:hypothetical protein NW767_000696 [Fusarium falciforme]